MQGYQRIESAAAPAKDAPPMETSEVYTPADLPLTMRPDGETPDEHSVSNALAVAEELQRQGYDPTRWARNRVQDVAEEIAGYRPSGFAVGGAMQIIKARQGHTTM